MRQIILGLCFALPASLTQATDAVTGKIVAHQSYYGTPEQCVRITPIPGGTYAKGDIKDERALCEIDFYSTTIALCPKIWATSAAVILYDISKGRFKGNRLGFQTKICEGGPVAKYVAHDKLARLKFSMNQQDTSGVYTPGPLLYYHLSRFFETETYVPVVVWRDIDRTVLLNEVAKGGFALTRNNAALRMNHAAWRTLVDTINDPNAYTKGYAYGTAADLIRRDGQTLYGMLYDGGGDPYGPAINGISDDSMHMIDRYGPFLQTPVIQALFADAPLNDAIATGMANGAASLAAGDKTATDIPRAQMVYWMREMSEILLLDHMLGQQDRLTNLDFRDYYYWVKDGKVYRKRARDRNPGEAGIPPDAIRLSRTRMNDNDAAARVEYKNHTRRLGLLSQLRHFDARIYAKLMELNAEFQAQGPVHDWLYTALGLEADQAAMIIANTAEAARILQASCARGELRFDLDAEEFMRDGAAVEVAPRC